jgi:hypothetical protein
MPSGSFKVSFCAALAETGKLLRSWRSRYTPDRMSVIEIWSVS